MATVVGIRCAKDQLSWAVLEGSSRTTATSLEEKQVGVPGTDRGEQLAWIRREVLELLGHHTGATVALHMAEPASPSPGASFGRVEVEGVVQASVAEFGGTCSRLFKATVRSRFGVKNGAELKDALRILKVLEKVPNSRQEPFIVALAELPAD